MAVPRILVTVGDRAPAVSGTPRSRIGAVVARRAIAAPAAGRRAAHAGERPDGRPHRRAGASLPALAAAPPADDPQARQKKEKRA